MLSARLLVVDEVEQGAEVHVEQVEVAGEAAREADHRETMAETMMTIVMPMIIQVVEVDEEEPEGHQRGGLGVRKLPPVVEAPRRISHLWILRAPDGSDQLETVSPHGHDEHCL